MKNPTTVKINLSEIPAEGREYFYNQKDGQLNQILQDLIGQNSYEVRIFIKPMGNAFEASGAVLSSKESLCAKCGFDLDLELKQKINEILIPEAEEYRKDHAVHGNGAIDFMSDGPNVTNFQAPFFNLGEFVHEMFALSEPMYPDCGKEVCENYEQVKKNLQEDIDVPRFETPKGHPAFSVLEKLKNNN